jgi:hypothetical protein
VRTSDAVWLDISGMSALRIPLTTNPMPDDSTASTSQ